jgi:hypothetical protein
MENGAMDDERDPNETDVDQSEADHLTPATESAFELFKNLLALVANEKAFKVRLAGLHRALQAADETQKKLVAAQTEFEAYQTKVRAELAEELAALRKRQAAVEVGEGALVEREEHIRRLELAWKHLGEPADVQSGFRHPEFTPLQKAQRAFAQQPAAELPLHSSGFDGGEFPAGVTLTRQPESPVGVRVRKVRAHQAEA